MCVVLSLPVRVCGTGDLIEQMIDLSLWCTVYMAEHLIELCVFEVQGMGQNR